MALINKLKAIANAIRSKTNKSEEITLEQMASEIEGIDVMQGLDFGAIYDQEQADEINQYYKDGIEYAKKIKKDWYSIEKNEQSLFENDKKIVFFPNVIISISENYFLQWFMYSSLIGNVFINSARDSSNFANFFRTFLATGIQKFDTNIEYVGVFSYMFYNCINLVSVNLHDISRTTEPLIPFYNCYLLQELRFTRWKNHNIQISQSNFLSPESIHYIIQNAVNLADGATERTLYLHATAKTNWQNSEYYQQDLAVLEQKGITIA